jgi:hypothetical protein
MDMAPGTRIFAASAIALLALIAVTFWFSPQQREPQQLSTAEPESLAAPTTSVPAQPTAAKVAARAGAPSLAPIAVQGMPQDPTTARCAACRDRECRSVQGVDIVDGCLKGVDATYGADPHDSEFVQDCEAVVQCAIKSGCASTPNGPVDCYCGSISVEECLERGPAPDAPCVEQWRRATRSGDTKQIAERFSDLKYPAGWGSLLIRCDHEACKDQCAS